MTWLILPILACFGVYYQAVIRRAGPLTADSIFVYVQLLMAIGSILLLDTAYHADYIYGYILAYTLIAYMVASAVIQFSGLSRHTLKEQAKPTVVQPGFTFWALALFSALIVVAYYQAVGYSALLQGLSNQFSGGTNADVAGLRLDSYSGSRYLFPGYVNQFKNALLPALVVLAITYWVRSGRMKSRILPALAWSVIVLFGLLGTGQRGAFVIFVATIVVYLYLSSQGKFSFRIIGLVLVFLVLITASTIALGRGNVTTSNAALSNQSGAALQQFSDRVVRANQSAGVIGFRYIYQYKEIQHGREWGESLIGVLPGVGGSTIANEIFAYQYGNDRGTSPPSLWGSIYYNFGYPGLALAPFVLAAVITRITRAGTRDVRRSSMETLGIAGVYTLVGFWVAGSPLFMLNGGILIYIALWVVGRRAARRADAEESPRRITAAPRRPRQTRDAYI